MERPRGLTEHRFVGDKRTQKVYDLDHCDSETAVGEVADLVAAESFVTFGPDTLAEARNRGYRLSPSCRG
ncbi:MAG TPA: hypothetical protein ENI86_10010 [Acidimicrobiales bacterium]|nr:hypothetical protein [Acidimicrobiales bacterium]